MKSKLELRAAAVNNHNIDLFIKSFIDYVPNRLQYACDMDMGEEERTAACYLDFFDFHYRRFLSGGQKNLSRVFFEIRSCLNRQLPEKYLIDIIIDIKHVILQAEFYELIPKLEASLSKIKKVIADHTLNSQGNTPF